MITDANLGIKENLQNIFFLEFEIINNNDNNSNIKIIQEIKNDIVNKEIFFKLNVKKIKF